MANLLTRPFAFAGDLLRRRFLVFRREALILWYALRHPDTPMPLRIGALLLGLYLLSPIDLVPITVPFFGIIDDLIIVPLGVSLVAGRLPAQVYADADARATQWIARYLKRPLLALAIFLSVLVAFWIAVLVLIWRLLFG